MGIRPTSRILMGFLALLVIASEALGQAGRRRRRRVELLSRSAVASTRPRTTTTARCSWSRRKALFWRSRSTLNSRSGSSRSWPYVQGSGQIVVYSHHHRDHASGGDVFADTAKFVGHANMRSHLAMPPASTTLSQVVGQYRTVAELDKNRNGAVDKARSAEHQGTSSRHSTPTGTACSVAPR